jgi:salicylate hydroxylase
MATTGAADEHVVIVGAGLAGLTLGAALTEAGIDCRVFEQAPALGEVGAGIQLAPNATRILHRLGMAEWLRKVAVRPEAVEMRRWDNGAVLGRSDLGATCEQRYGAPYYAVHRADLHQGLANLLPADTVRLGRQCAGVEESPAAARLRFTDGSAVAADVCVGADGIHSVVRDLLSVDEPRFSGQTIYRGVVPADRVPFLLDEPKVVLWLGPHQHFVCYPIAAGELVSFGATVPSDRWYAESWSMPAAVADLAGAYHGWHPDVAAVIDAAQVVRRWALHDRRPIAGWRTDHVTLIGDAAHPMLPFLAQGANQAIEDAAVLAGCLAATGDGPPGPALARYERLRTARTTRVQELSQRNATALHLDDGPAHRPSPDESQRGAEQRGADQRRAEQRWLYEYDAAAVLAE